MRGLFGQRFEIEARVASGGMGDVYRALDHQSGAHVALKTLRNAKHTHRFEREAQILAGLDHPGVVAYVAHGMEDGKPYLAMEWLEGEDLKQRLERQSLTVEDSLKVAKQVADALRAAHTQGLIHRDLKPSNLFLVGHSVDHVKILDFGVARTAQATMRTEAGALLGTPVYMAPEQAKGERDIDGRVDVFALGCVLYECLTGRPAFRADKPMAVLAKILLEQVPAPSTIADVPQAVDELVLRMLSKERDRRPSDAGAALGAIEYAQEGRTGQSQTSLPALTNAEAQLVSVVIAAGEHDRMPSATGGSTGDVSTATATATAGGTNPFGTLASLGEVAARSGARMSQLADGSCVFQVRGTGAIADQAGQAAHCALGVLQAAPDARIALATGRALQIGSQPVGEVIDRAVSLLGELERGRGVIVDDTTASLLRERFVVEESGGIRYLVGERHNPELPVAPDSLFVGRRSEMALLTAAYDACVEEPAAACVLVTGPAGTGKSRLARELLVATDGAAQVWIGRGDPTREGVPLGMISEVLRQAAGVADGEDAAVARARLEARVSRTVPAADASRVTAFVGEIIGLTFPEEADPGLAAARRDPQVMRDQKLRAWLDWVAAECRRGPLILMFEDLHWADGVTVAYVDHTLRLLTDAPLFVLALARPEVETMFPALWSRAARQEVKLRGLPAKAAETLVRHRLGTGASDAMVAQVIAQAEGNAFFLEELIRAAARGEDRAPETALGMVEARLARLDPHQRRILRAGAVFGDRFWVEGVIALLGGKVWRVQEQLDTLEKDELITPSPSPRFAGRREYSFRHDMIRDAAYATLAPHDRSLGHRLAADWLVRAGEREGRVLANHFERGGDQVAALAWTLTAMQRSIAADDMGGAQLAINRALTLGARGEDLGRVRACELQVALSRVDNAGARRVGEEALALLPVGGWDWFRAASELTVALRALGDMAALAELRRQLEQAPAEGVDVRAARGRALMSLAVHYTMVGEFALAEEIVRAEADEVARLAPIDPGLAALWETAIGFRAGFDGELDDEIERLVRAAELHARAGDSRLAARRAMNTGIILVVLGRYDDAIARTGPALEAARQLGVLASVCYGKYVLAAAYVRAGRWAEADSAIDEALRLADVGDDRGAVLFVRAELEWRRGDLAAAEVTVREAVVHQHGPYELQAKGLLARILLDGGRSTEALAIAEEACAVLEGGMKMEEDEQLLRLAHVEALAAAGQRERAVATLRRALARLDEMAGKLRSEEARHRFLALPEHARLHTLAAAWSVR